MSENKNGYEIRLELLHLAQSIISENVHIRREWDEMKRDEIRVEDAGVECDGEPPDAPQSYTTEEVVGEARKLYAFVKEDTSSERF